MGAKKSEQQHDVSDLYAFYVEYNKLLRTWFVAFGIGGPALMLANEKVAERLAKIGELRFVATLFLIGVASQVGGVFVNKVANWYAYRSETYGANRSQWKYKAADWVLGQFWIDIALDVTTMICFGLATWQILTAYAK